MLNNGFASFSGDREGELDLDLRLQSQVEVPQYRAGLIFNFNGWQTMTSNSIKNITNHDNRNSYNTCRNKLKTKPNNSTSI